MIRSTFHSIKFSNKNKQLRYLEFISEYRRVSNIIGNSICNNGYKNFNIQTDNLNLPKYINYKDFNVDTWLSARALSSLVTQLSSIIRGTAAKRKKTLYIINKLKEDNKDCSLVKDENIVIPNFLNINPELSSKNIDIKRGNYFDLFISIKSIGKNKIIIPIKKTSRDCKWEKIGKLLGGFGLSEKEISFRYEINQKTENNSDEIVGADQGLNDVLVLSNGNKTPKKDIHDHNLHSILNKLSKCKKGSKGFKRAQDHRKNFINWSINQLNLKQYKEIKFEKIINIGYKKSKSRKMSHWCNTLIRDKVKRVCEEKEVLFSEQSSIYRSQRCSNCELVLKSNRKGKIYKCNACKLEIDSDLNAAKNHLCDLPAIPFDFIFKKMNKNGFFWKSNGLFSLKNEEIRVLHIKKNNLL